MSAADLVAQLGHVPPITDDQHAAATDTLHRMGAADVAEALGLVGYVGHTGAKDGARPVRRGLPMHGAKP